MVQYKHKAQRLQPAISWNRPSSDANSILETKTDELAERRQGSQFKKSRANVVLDAPSVGHWGQFADVHFLQSVRARGGNKGSGRGRDGGVVRRNKAKWDSGGSETIEHLAVSHSPLKPGALRPVYPCFRGSGLQNKITLLTLSLPLADRVGISIQALATVPLRPAQ